MNTSLPPQSHSRIHPLVATAAVALTLFSAVGIAALTGGLPTGKAASADAAPAPQATASAPSPVANAVPPAPTPVAQPRPHTPTRTPAAPRTTVKPASASAETAPATAPIVVAQAPAAVCGNCGVVSQIREITQPGEASGVGAVAGGVVGAILGHQIGGGTGRQLATIAGAAGGAYAGHQIEKSQRKSTRYEVVVKMDDGTNRSVMVDMLPGWQVGERVRIENGALTRD